MSYPKYLIIHHTGGTDAQPLSDSSNYTVEQCNNDHKVRFNMKSSLGWYVGYTYFIDKKGVVTKTREDTEIGAHTIGKNKESIGICLAGNFDATLPTSEQIDSLKKLIQEKMSRSAIALKNVVPHRAFAHKTCYGTKLSDDWAQSLIKGIQLIPQTPFTKVLRMGDSGEEVEKLQKWLVERNYLVMPANVAYGIFGPLTRDALMKFQRESGLVADGVCGPKTLKVLNQ